jgi:hypothetical protein
MWLVDSIGIIVAELFDDLADFVVFLIRTCISHDPLKPVYCEQRTSDSSKAVLLKGTLFPFVVELVGQQALNSLVHVERCQD